MKLMNYNRALEKESETRMKLPLNYFAFWRKLIPKSIFRRKGWEILEVVKIIRKRKDRNLNGFNILIQCNSFQK